MSVDDTQDTLAPELPGPVERRAAPTGDPAEPTDEQLEAGDPDDTPTVVTGAFRV